MSIFMVGHGKFENFLQAVSAFPIIASSVFMFAKAINALQTKQ
jgi:large-conductance mechanosensitive channel